MIKLNKGQMEIFGIAIVVVVLLMGALFALRLTNNDADESDQNTFNRVQMSTNFLNSMLTTTSECKGLKMSEVYEKCAVESSFMCYQNQDVCDYLNESTYFMLNATLRNWGVPYHFKAQITKNPNLITEFKNGCDTATTTRGRNSMYPISLYASGVSGTLVVSLFVCY